MAILKALKQQSFCEGLSDKELANLAKLIQEKKFPAQTPIFVERMLAESLCIIKNGQVRITIRDDDGDEIPLNLLETGDYFGCLGLFEGSNRQVSAYADPDTELMILERDDFQRLEEEHPQVALKIYRAVCSQLTARLLDCLPLLKQLAIS